MHLVVDISSHGFGHIAITAPVIDALARRLPDLRITLRCAVPRSTLEARFSCRFEHSPEALDFGMIMASAVDVDVPASAAAYAELHRDWDRRVDLEASKLLALGPDLLLANVPYLSLAAAARAGVPCASLSCLNWAEIYIHCCGDAEGAASIHEQMVEAYDSGPFLQAEPSMPMPGLRRPSSVGPIASVGVDRRREIGAAIGLAPNERLVSIALGGIPTRLPVERWPEIPGLRRVIPAAWGVPRRDMVTFESLGLPFSDVLRSSDAVVTKPGYGTFTEAACAGVAVLYMPRPGWPEAPALERWLETHGRCLTIDRERLERGDMAGALDALLSMPGRPIPSPTGASEAAGILEAMLSGHPGDG